MRHKTLFIVSMLLGAVIAMALSGCTSGNDVSGPIMPSCIVGKPTLTIYTTLDHSYRTALTDSVSAWRCAM